MSPTQPRTARTGGGAGGGSDRLPWHYPEHPLPVQVEKWALVDQLRGLAQAVAQIDASAAEVEQLTALRAEISALGERVQELPVLPDLKPGQGYAADHRLLTERGPITGRSNLVAPPVRVQMPLDGPVVRAEATFSRLYEGPPGIVHGGVMLMVFDEILAMAQVGNGRLGVTATITVELVAPTPVQTPIHFEAGAGPIEGRRAHTWAEARLADGTELARARAICVLAAR